jgi:hypothetical protein
MKRVLKLIILVLFYIEIVFLSSYIVYWPVIVIKKPYTLLNSQSIRSCMDSGVFIIHIIQCHHQYSKQLHNSLKC